VVLLVVVSCSLIAPALFAGDGSNLPACCRRDGAHRCAMRTAASAQESPDGLAIRTPSPVCPAFPKLGPVPSGAKTPGLQAAQAIFASLMQHPAVQPQTEALYRVSFTRTGQKRGPPSLLS